jgi:glycosyltransferase 2 family protein
MIVAFGKATTIGRVVGWTAVVASLGFIGIQLWQHAPWRLAGTHLEALAAAIVGGALLYGIAGFLLSSAWYQLLSAGGSSASLRSHHAVYGRTQIAKYLPGNVFHLVGRQVMGRQLGYGQGRLALASLLEAVLLMLIAAALGLPMVLQWLAPGPFWVLAFAAPVLALIAARWAGRHDLVVRDLAQEAGPRPLLVILRLLPAAILYALFFLVVATIFWMLALSVADPGGPSIGLAASVSVVALAWLVGFATPGSSAGIGVREAVLIATLEGSLGAPASGLIALALRLVTIAGDVVFFIFGVTLGLADERPKSAAFGDDPA